MQICFKIFCIQFLQDLESLTSVLDGHMRDLSHHYMYLQPVLAQWQN